MNMSINALIKKDRIFINGLQMKFGTKEENLLILLFIMIQSFFLMYLMNQIADHFADSRINGDDNYNSNLSILSEIMSNLPPSPSSSSLDPNLSNSATTIRNAVNIIHQALQPYAIKATAGLLYWFAVETGQLPRPEIWSGTITQNTTWSGTICLNGSVIVNNNSILTIEPGTTIEFWGPYTITVNSGAKVIAQGSSSQPIRFTSATGTTPGSWKYVQLQGGNSIFKYCVFEYGQYPIYLYNATSGNPTLIENCEIKNSTYGIYCKSSKAKVKSCDLHHNTYGIFSNNSTQLDVIGTRIHHNNSVGVNSYSGGLVRFYGSVIESNGNHGLSTFNSDVIYIGYPYTWLGYNTVRSNTGTEVYANSGSPQVRICYSSVHDNTGLEVYNYPGNTYAVSTLNGFWASDGCQYQGNVVLDTPYNSIPDWDGQLKTSGSPLEKSLGGGMPESEKERVETLKKIIAQRPESAEGALVELYGIIRGDYVENRLGEKDSFYAYLEGLYGKHKEKKLGKRALRYQIIWDMLEGRNEKAILLSKKALKELDKEEHGYILLDLAYTYLRLGLSQKARECLSSLKNGYDMESEILLRLEEDIRETDDSLAKGLIQANEMVSPEIGEEKPEEAVLLENYPNPGNPSTTLCFHLSESRNVSLKVFNLLGQEVRELVNGKKEAGTYSIVWDGKDNRNREMASGVYVFVLKLDDKIISKKFTLIR